LPDSSETLVGYDEIEAENSSKNMVLSCHRNILAFCSSEEVKLLMNFSKGSLHVTDVREWLRVHETELDFKISNKEAIKTTDKKGIYLAEHVDDSLDTPEIDEADSEYEVLMAAAEELGLDPVTSAPDEEIFEESDAKEILATMVRDHGQGKGRGKSGGKRTFQQASRMKKTKELSREYGRGRSGFLPTGTYRVSVEELKRKTRCSVCHQIGHWHRDRECPGKAGASKEVQLLESDEALFIHFLEYQDYKNEQQAEVHHLSRDDEWDPLQEAVSQRMHQQQKRSRAMEQKRDAIPQWRRLALRLLLMIRQMMISQISNRLHMSGPPGMRTRLVINELENMSESDLEVSPTGRTGATQTGGFLSSQWRKGQEDTGLHPRTSSSKNSGAAQVGTSISGDVTEYGQQSTTSPMPLSSDDHTPDLEEGGDQPFWSPSPNKKGVIPLLPTADPQTAKYPTQMDPKICPRYNVTKAGSNGWIEQTRCIDCQTILERKQRTKPASAASSHQDSAIPGDQQAWEEFQEFKQFCQMQRRRTLLDSGCCDIISLDRQVDEHYYTSEETAEIFAEGEDLIPALDAPFYGSQENEFTIQAKEHLPAGDWKFWTRTDLQVDKYQTTKGDGPHFNLVDYRLTFNLETKELIKLESVSDLNSDELEKALESENQNIVTVFAWQKLRELAGSRQVSLERRVRAKTAIGDYAERSADPPGEQPAPESGAVLPPPGLAPAVDGQGQPFVSEPDLEYTPSEPPIEPELPDTEMTADHGEKREHEDDTTEDIVSPPDKRQRVEFLETVLQKCGMTKKRKEHTAKDFTGKDWHRLIKAIAKEINQNLASGAYELLDRTTSEEVRRSKLDKIMGSRYVLVKKPLEDAEVDKARVEDLSLDDQEHGPVKDYKLGKNQQKAGRFTGKDIRQLGDGSIENNQSYYVGDKVKLIPLEKKRRSQRYDKCT
ncbi:GRF-type domain-containing protein, partial [Durusdinium trenchii]